jgi:CheY-like chemotaxis protein
MNLEAKLAALKNQSQDLTPGERAQLSCNLAKQLEKAGDYEAAREALAEFWPDRHEPLSVDSLDEPTRAEVLLRVGGLVGWLGSADQTSGGQERAKDLITRSIEIFSALDEPDRMAEARADLALCYWREGAFDEARITLDDALKSISEEQDDLRACTLIRSGMVEATAGRSNEALRFYEAAMPFAERSKDSALKGTFHNSLATLLTRLAATEERKDYSDRALIEYAAASMHFEEAGNDRYVARVENNLGNLFFNIGRHKDAHRHLDRARSLFRELKDIGTAAQVDETRARTLMAEGQLVQAERVVRSAVKTLERGGEQAVLAEALNTYGIVMARLGHQTRSRALLDRAASVAETIGDLAGAGRAQLSIIEELGDRMPVKELIAKYRIALELLKNSQDPLARKRLMDCSDRLLSALENTDEANQHLEPSWEGFSFKRQVVNYERNLIERALRDAEGSVTKAAQLLGFKHHQSLISLISGRHKHLLKLRSTVRKRRRHLFSASKHVQKTAVHEVKDSTATQLSILHIEDDKTVAKSLGETLASKGFDVDTCVSGTTALKVLTGDTHYDIIICDNDLPGLSGLELVRRVRNMARWRGTPIIMLAAEDCENEAWRAGVSEFLRKPEDIERVASTIRRLLADLKEKPG